MHSPDTHRHTHNHTTHTTHSDRQVNPSLTVMRHDCLIEQLPQFSLTLASEHFGLRHLRVTGIPMKESNKEASERIISDVTILHPMAAHSPLAPDAFAAAPLGAIPIGVCCVCCVCERCVPIFLCCALCAVCRVLCCVCMFSQAVFPPKCADLS